MEAALKQVFDERIDAATHNMSGKTDPQICYELLTSLGYTKEEVDSKLPLAFKVYVELLEMEIEKAGRYGLHLGVVELIRELEAHPECYLGLLTGNIEEGARLKLTPFDLNSFFVFGAFGSDSADRMDLPLFAHKRANEIFGKVFERDEIVIIGDAVNDVLCAKGYGVKSVITATGKTQKETLAALNPDYLFDSLADTKLVYDAIMS